MLAGISAIGGFVGEFSAGGGSFWIEISPETISKTGGKRGTGTRSMTTEHVTITPHGGSGSPTYAWARTSGDAGITADSPTSASTTFTATLGGGDELTAVFECTATDSSGAVQKASVTVTLALIDYGSTL
jgi:hypothetical protein